MNDTTIVILTGLLTSGFTVILTKVFDIIKLKSEHKIHLRKQFFEKRLAYAEKTIVYLNEKADLFNHLGRVLMSFHPDKTKELFDKKLFNSLEWISEIFFEELDTEEIFKIKIPPGSWLYFDMDSKELPNKDFDESNIELIKDLKKIEHVFDDIKLPSEKEQERIKNLPSEERIKWIVEFLSPITQLQISFLQWAKLLFDARDKLQRVSMSIEKEFKKYK